MFWDNYNIILIDYLEKGKSITEKYYSAFLDELPEKIVENRHEIVFKGILILQDNTPAHKTQFEVRISGVHLTWPPRITISLRSWKNFER